jgi:hypothetical protein
VRRAEVDPQRGAEGVAERDDLLVRNTRAARARNAMVVTDEAATLDPETSAA